MNPDGSLVEWAHVKKCESCGELLERKRAIPSKCPVCGGLMVEFDGVRSKKRTKYKREIKALLASGMGFQEAEVRLGVSPVRLINHSKDVKRKIAGKRARQLIKKTNRAKELERLRKLGMTLEEIGVSVGLTKERVRQILLWSVEEAPIKVGRPRKYPEVAPFTPVAPCEQCGRYIEDKRGKRFCFECAKTRKYERIYKIEAAKRAVAAQKREQEVLELATKLKRLKESGLSVVKLSEKYGMSEGRIYHLLKKVKD
jgi:transposase-like protein